MTKTIKVYDKKEFEEKWPTGQFDAGPWKCNVVRSAQMYYPRGMFDADGLREDAGAWTIQLHDFIYLTPEAVDEFCAMLQKAKQYAKERP